jgi:hypothetical protein
MGMGRKTRVGQLEEKIKGPEPRESFDWEAEFGEIGVLTRDCIILFLTNSQPGERNEGYLHQLMRVGTFALTNLTGDRPVRDVERDALRQLMTDPEYRGFGWTELKHAKALQLYRMCAARGWLDIVRQS